MADRVTKRPILGRRPGSDARRVRVFKRCEVNPAAQRLERALVDVLAPSPDREPHPRRLYLKQSCSPAHGTSDHCLGCGALVSGGRAQGHTEFVSRKVEEVRSLQSPLSSYGSPRG